MKDVLTPTLTMSQQRAQNVDAADVLLRQMDENAAVAHAGSKRPLRCSEPATPLSPSRISSALEAKRKRAEDSSQPISTAIIPAGGAGGRRRRAAAIPASPTVGKVFHVVDNDELQRLVENGEGASDTSVIFLAHAEWCRTSVNEVIDDIHLHTDVSAVPIYTVNVDVVDDAGELLDIKTPTLPLIILYHFDQGGASRKIVEKKAVSAAHVHAVSLVEPVHTVEHLQQRLAKANACDGPASFTVLYLGASWCPPCMRILQHLPEMLPQLPKTISQVLKVDKDTAPSIFHLLDVEIIPTFVVLRNVPVGAEGWAPDVVAKLQSSNPVAVSSFIERHCAVLTFGLDEDF